MFKKIKYNPLILILLHITFGYFGSIGLLMKVLYLGVFFYSLADIYRTKNRSDEALLWACYFVGAEVFFRMTKSTISYEFGKYSVIGALVMGMLVRSGQQKISISYFIYLFLLLIGIVFTDVPDGESIRRAITFNLTGPVVLFISALYFYGRKVSRNTLLEGLVFMVFPIFSMISYMYFRTPDLKEIVFRGSANFETSGGFGPNQVATVIGLGMFILAVLVFLNKKLSGYVFLDVIFLIYFTYRGLLTFSRGGIFTGAIAFFIFVLFMFFYKKDLIKIIFKYVLIGFVALVAIWLYTSDVTGGMLDNRYTGKNARGEQKEDITSGRLDIMSTQFENFYKSPWFGIGVGNGKYLRMESDEGVTAASHNEATRLIEEHGFLGVLILMILILVPTVHFINSSNYQRAFLISFYVFWFLTINHSAMRIAFPGFIYGLSLIKITRDED
ncbi:O-antigen ligase family protein [Flavicella marina]|uniref:O-antigen ligase family protein n=1 Tax=Flavicella marina TaxID=1475951 RepID=UPI001264E94F|nr:O-antigen ligase family protein [Flavicella marina]